MFNSYSGVYMHACVCIYCNFSIYTSASNDKEWCMQVCMMYAANQITNFHATLYIYIYHI